MLDELSGRGREMAVAVATIERGKGVQKLRYSHDAMIDLIISRPEISQNEIASIFNMTPSWVSQLINCDMFQAKLAQRRDEIVNPALRLTIEERFRALTARSLEVLQEKLSRDPSAVPDNLALRTAELGAKALGIGGNAPAPVIPIDHLAGLADRLLALQGRARGVYREAETVEVIEAVEINSASSSPVGGQGLWEAASPDAG